MKKVLLFAGTTEGRELAEYFDIHRIPVTVSVATEYGAALLRPSSYVEIIQGRKNRGQIRELLESGEYCCCVDATHPFAVLVSEEIRAACDEEDIRYLRLARETSHEETDGSGAGEKDFEVGGKDSEADGKGSETGGKGFGAGGNLIYVDSLQEAVAVLRALPGNIFLMTGSKELPVIAEEIGEPDRLFARVLPTQTSLDLCRQSGLPESHIIAMQGPFSAELNAAMLRQTGAGCVLTKESGTAGGFEEKILAAEECGIPVVIIRNPEKASAGVSGKAGREAAGTEGGASRCTGGRTGFYSFREVISKVEQILGMPRTLTLAGIGPGGSAYRTDEYWKALAEADILFGAPRMLKEVQNDLQKLLSEAGQNVQTGVTLGAGQSERGGTALPGYPWYQGERIFFFLQEHPQYRHPLVAFSGDSGLFSGARKVREVFMRSPFAELESSGRWEPGTKLENGGRWELDAEMPDDAGKKRCGELSADATPGEIEMTREQQLGSCWRIRTLCGISSVSAMAARLGITWQDSAIVSAHGRRCSVVARLRTCRKMFLLISDLQQCAGIGENLLKAQKERTLPGNLRVAYGYRIGLPEESIKWISVQTLADLPEVFREGGGSPEGETAKGSESKGQLLLLYFENPAAEAAGCVPGIPDEKFIRGRVPMTKEEIRILVLSRLHLTRNAVVWDVGAGTGSVSIEAALLCPEGTVYAIERTQEALSLLKANCDKFATDNVEIVSGEAPAVLTGLPDPGHVFIGGSGGNMQEILYTVLRANPEACVVITCVTLETLREVQKCISLLSGRITEPRIAQIAVSKTRRLGNYHLLQAQNPVFLIDFKGRKE